MYLTALILIPLLSGLVVAVAPERYARMLALLGTLIPAVLGAYLIKVFDWGYGQEFQLGPAQAVEWIRPLGLRLSLGVDSVSLVLVLLTLLLGPICVVASKTAITTRIRTYYAWLLVLQAAMTGVFCARDVIFFYICFEFTLVPMFVLISLWGSTNRRKAAIKFFLYTFTGSIIALAGLMYVAWFNSRLDPGGLPTLLRNQTPMLGTWTFDIATLAVAAREMSLSEQSVVLLALMAGFAVKVPLFPVHTWLPLAHTEAPTAGSVILAGVLLKLGTYAMFRFVLPFVPLAVAEYAPLMAVLAIIGIIYAGLICWVQTDVKKLVAYSSVAHLGFCVLGLFALNHTGITGAILYMVNHGLSTGALFLLIGMVYERYHTRSMKELGGLAAKMPVWATFMVFFTMASVGLPGLNGFVSEFLCLLGAFQASSAWGSGLWGSIGAQSETTGGELGPWFAAIAAIGMIIAAIYLLYMVGRVVWGPLVEPHHDHDDPHGGAAHAVSVLPTDLSPREIGVLMPLALLCIGLGIYPSPLIRALENPVAKTTAIYEDVWSRPRPAPVMEQAAVERRSGTEVSP